jgi:hypothetical protein
MRQAVHDLETAWARLSPPVKEKQSPRLLNEDSSSHFLDFPPLIARLDVAPNSSPPRTGQRSSRAHNGCWAPGNAMGPHESEQSASETCLIPCAVKSGHTVATTSSSCLTPGDAQGGERSDMRGGEENEDQEADAESPRIRRSARFKKSP